MRKFVGPAILISLLCLIGVAIAALFPIYRDMPRRHQIAELILSTNVVRGEIAARAQAKKSLTGSGVGLTIPAGNVATSGEVSADGIVIVRGLVDGYPVEIAFKPDLKSDLVEWRCGGLKGVEGFFVRSGAYFPRDCPLVPSLDALSRLPRSKNL